MLFHVGLMVCIFVDNVGTERQYLIIQDSQLLCEVQRCSDEPRSWFVGESVQTGQKCTNNGEEGSKVSCHRDGLQTWPIILAPRTQEIQVFM